jgi:hypothetical protein
MAARQATPSTLPFSRLATAKWFALAGNRWRATMYAQTMHVQKPHWLDYDPVALAVLVIGIGIIELLALII